MDAAELPTRTGGQSANVPRLLNCMRNIELGFNAEFDVDRLFEVAADWLISADNDTARVGNVSQVGILCSPEFASLVQQVLPRQMVEDFQVMLWALTMLHCYEMSGDTGGHVPLPSTKTELEEAGAQAGERFLNALEHILRGDSRPNTGAITTISPDSKIKSTFLLVLGAIICLAYTKSPADQLLFPKDSPTPNVGVCDAVKSQLCVMLAHHMLWLARKANMKFPPEWERRLVDRADALWDKTGSFSWRLRAQQSDSNRCLTNTTDVPESSDGSSSRLREKEMRKRRRRGLTQEAQTNAADNHASAPTAEADIPTYLKQSRGWGNSRGRFRTTLWYCCQCGTGNSGAVNPSCIGCNHVVCDECKVQTHCNRFV